MRKAEDEFSMINQGVGGAILIPPLLPFHGFRVDPSAPESAVFPNKIASFSCHTEPESFPEAQVFGETNGETNFAAKILFPCGARISFCYRALDSP
jgi:hypothetical protein